MKYLQGLNDKQIEAVKTTEGPVLILAGAGSGKTTVLVNRLAYILAEKNVSPFNVLAITFTNKAANEMKERIKAKVGSVADTMWISTFHSMCVRILRSCIDRLGYSKDFIIYDTSDQKALVKECMKDLNIDEKKLEIRSVMSEISNAKNQLLSTSEFAAMYMGDFRLRKISEIYTLYQQKMKKNNALDFDDLISNTIKIFRENPDILENYQDKFKYIMVDEYQDTNNAQFLLVHYLSGKYKNLCVVGDDDQSIYRFRGANIQNILGFEQEFPDTVTIKLEQNYRSTQTILDAANAVIANNKGRKGKKLWTEHDKGDKIKSFVADSDRGEAEYIVKQISEQKEAGRKYSDCAVLYRMNAQSRAIEESLVKSGIPYRVLAGLRFYDRKEIKDMLAYLRVIHNPNDDLSLKRIINEPRRGIGDTSIEKAQRIADAENISLFDVIKNADNYQELKRSHKVMSEFSSMMERLIAEKDSVKISELLNNIMTDTGYSNMLKALNDVESASRIENINELLSVILEYEADEENDVSLAGFLERISLASDVDKYDTDEDCVVLMTIHSAKGLEFPIVFLPGLESGIFPGHLVYDEEDMEEERRLCYVAITRAKEQLYISRAERRMIFGKTVYQPPSKFLDEIPKKYLSEKISTSAAVASMAKSFGFYTSFAGQTKESKLRQTAGGVHTQSFEKNDRVRHPKFGDGTVISAQQFGNDCKLEIAFDSGEKKMLMAVFAKLEKI